jgi:hypothetical protein
MIRREKHIEIRLRVLEQLDEMCKRGKFPGERRWIYAGAGRMRLARGGIFGPGMPRRAPMNS